MNELANDIRQGNERAFQTFFHQTHFRVIRYLHTILGDNRYTDDIAQDVFIKVWQNREQINPAYSLEAWLFTIVRHCAATHLRKMLADKKRLHIIQQDAPSPFTNGNEGVLKLQYQDVLKAYSNATQALAPQHLRCFLLHREQGLTYPQIADVEGISVKTVEKYISNVLRQLRKVSPSNYGLIGFALFMQGM